MNLSQPLLLMPAILGDSTCAVLPSDIHGAKIQFPSCTLMWYFVPFFVFYTESVMLSLRFIPESVFYTQSVMLSPPFLPQSMFYTQSVVRSPQSWFYTD